jgi:hypothetical protein
MTRYFFDVREGDFVAADENGMPLQNVNEALKTARAAAAEIAGDVLQSGNTDRVTVEVRDDKKKIGRVTVCIKTETFEP